MKVGVFYASTTRHANLSADLPDGATVKDAIEKSGILKQFPEIDVATAKAGIFSKLVKLDSAVADGDRVEIYRPITCDPKTVKRRPKGEGDGDAEE
ncbi:MAG: RnfH family protein [Sulfuricella sp.]|nr:RnfH family protein [Sulfuricella sp.]